MSKKIILSLSLALSLVFCVNAQDEKKAEASGDAKKIEKEAPKDVAASDAKAEAGDDAVPFKKNSVWNKLIWYIPNRCLDVDDIFTTTIGIGPEVSLYLRATNYMQFGGGIGEKYYLAKDYHRQYGGAHFDGWNFGFGCLSKDYACVDESFGSVKDYVYEHKSFGMPSYKNDIYRDNIADFWALEVKAGWLISVGVAVHPVEIVDCLLGIFLLDSMKDDEDGSWKDLKE